MARRSAHQQVDPGQAKPARVAHAIERDIRSGKLGFGQRLQSENELVERFSMSRATIRKGLEELVGKGLITTKTGIGSFVTFDGQVIDNALGWTRALADQRAEIETKILRIEIIKDAALAKMLKQNVSVFIAIDRTRSIKGKGKSKDRIISIERSRVPYLDELQELPLRGLTNGSLSQTLRESGLIGNSGEEWAEIECLSKPDAKLVDVPAATPFMRTRRLLRDENGRLIEYVISLLDPQHFALHLEF